MSCQAVRWSVIMAWPLVARMVTCNREVPVPLPKIPALWRRLRRPERAAGPGAKATPRVKPRWARPALIVCAALIGIFASFKLHAATMPQPPLTPGVLMPVPSGFLWGVATAGHQWEGGDTTSNWNAWERAGHVKELPGRAADGWNQYTSDLDLARGMGLNSFRMSIEWSRIEPHPGKIDWEAVAHYHRMLAACHERGLEPIVTLLHYTYPAWLDDQAPAGGSAWETTAAVESYVHYVDFASREFGPQIRYYLTFNEPTVMVEGGYLAGCWPPGKKDLGAFLSASSNVIEAHSRAFDIIHANDPDARVSFNNYAAAYQLSIDPAKDSLPAPGDDWFLKAFANLAVPTKLGEPERVPKLDYVAVDYYKRLTIPTQIIPPSPSQWHVFPAGFDEVLSRYYKVFHLPILIAENGLATDNLKARADGWTRDSYVVEHIAQVQRAMSQGIPVIGYTYWTLTDNYEWGSFNDRFGLYSVECRSKDLTRVPTAAVAVYKEIVAHGGATVALMEAHGYRRPAPVEAAR
jgi:beta-glucosidase